MDALPEYEDSFRSPAFLYKRFQADGKEVPARKRSSSPRRTGRAYRRVERIAHDKRARSIIHLPGYNPYVGWIDTENEWDCGIWKCVEVGTHVKYPKNSDMRVYWKAAGAKCVRRYKGSIPDGSAYKKIFDLWWRML